MSSTSVAWYGHVVDVVLAPDIYVNASVAFDSPPERVVRRAFGSPVKPKTSTWVMERVQSMLYALPDFRDEAIAQHMSTIRGLVDVVESGEHYIEDWQEALAALAKAAGVRRVLTDHPDLLATRTAAGIEFVSSNAWLDEQTSPPPPPVV